MTARELPLTGYRLTIPAAMVRRMRGVAIVDGEDARLDTDLDLAWPLHALVRHRVEDIVRFEDDACARLVSTDAFRVGFLNQREADKRFIYARTPRALALYNVEQRELLVYGDDDRALLVRTIDAKLAPGDRPAFARAVAEIAALAS